MPDDRQASRAGGSRSTLGITAADAEGARGVVQNQLEENFFRVRISRVTNAERQDLAAMAAVSAVVTHRAGATAARNSRVLTAHPVAGVPRPPLCSKLRQVGSEVCVVKLATQTGTPASAARLCTVRLALAQVAPRLGDLPANIEQHLETIEAARDASADVVVFPELSTAGYQLKDLVPDVALRGDGARFRALVEASRGLALGFGFVEESADHRFYNSYAFCEDGRLLHVHRKVYLPTYGLFEEGRLYAAGEHVRAFDAGLGRLGMLLCEDVWHPSTMYLLSQDGAELVIAAAASPLRGADVSGDPSNVGVWHNALQMYSQLFGCFVVLVNRVGFEDGLCFWGGSRVVAPGGRIAFEAPLLEAGLFTCEIDWNEVRRHRVGDPTLRSERLDLTLAELERIQRERRERRAGTAGLVGGGEEGT